MTAAEARTRAPLGQRAKPGLQLSIGRIVERGDRSHPEKLDHFRCKPGPYADKFTEVFGDKPTEIRIAVADDLPAVLDIRWKSYAGGAAGKKEGGYLRALGQSNYVDRALTGDSTAVNGPETLTVWAKDGRKGEVEISGPGDEIVARFGLKVYTTFRFWIPEVLGLGAFAEIATTSEVSTHNLFRALEQQWRMLRGRWIGLPLVLYLQPATARPVVGGKRITSKYWALAVRTPLSVAEFLDQQQALAPVQVRQALPPVAHDDLGRDDEVSGLFGEHPAAALIRETVDQLPHAEDEPLRTREEPTAADRPDDALLNRIATLRSTVEDAAADALLVAAFGREHVEQLTAGEAAMYANGLERMAAQTAEQVDDADVEVVA